MTTTRETDRAVRAIIASLRDACGSCAYKRICGFGPVGFQIARVRDGDGSRHAHHRVLADGVARLRAVPGWQKALLPLLGEREKDALLVGCLLATAWEKKPERMAKLIAYTADRTGVQELRDEANEAPPARRKESSLALGAVDPEKLRTRMVRGQVLRAAAFATTTPDLRKLAELLVLDQDEEGRLFQYEAVAALALLVGTGRPGAKWAAELEAKALSPFRATFASRAGEDGSFTVFFPYRRGKRRSYLLLSRDADGSQILATVDKVRVDDLLARAFSVFDTDERKTWRILKEVCRHLNVRAAKLDMKAVERGLERLSRPDAILLGLYAPALAKIVGKVLGAPGFHALVKLLYKLRAESTRRGGPSVPAHEKVARALDDWRSLREALGDDFPREVFALVFRLNEGYTRATYTTDTYIGIGEVAYLLTAAAGWNPRGLDLELGKARKALALVAYGLQPPDRFSAIRLRKLERARERLASGSELGRACEIGMRYMASVHGFSSVEELEDAAGKGALSPEGARSGESDPGLPARDAVEASAEGLPSLDAESRPSYDDAREEEPARRRPLPRSGKRSSGRAPSA